jgi:hypothetical protein
VALDATVAGAAANSYLTLAAADALAADDLGPEAAAWLSQADDAKREAALRRATRELDAYLRTGWARYSAAQALLFPRLIDQDASGALLPRNVQLACYEQATYVLANAAVMDRANSRRARDLASAAEPNTSYSEGGQELPTLSPQALQYLAGYRTAGSSRGLRSVRMSSGYLP